MNPQDDERWYDAGPDGSEFLGGTVDIIVSLVMLPISIVMLIVQFFRWWMIEWVYDSPWAKRAHDRSKDRSM